MGSQRRSLPPLPSLLVCGAVFLLWAPTPFTPRFGTASGGLLCGSALAAGGSATDASGPSADSYGEITGGLDSNLGAAAMPRSTTGGFGDGSIRNAGLPASQEPACLSPVVEELRFSCDNPDLRIVWALSETVAARLAASPKAGVVRVQGDGCSDRVVVQVVLTEGTATNRYLLSGDVEVYGVGLRAVRTLRAGTNLTAEDVAEGEDWFPPSALRAAAIEVEGAHVMRAIPAGRVVTGEDIGPPPLVRRGETIRVVYRARGLELRTLGTARRDGWMGDRLTVRAIGAQHDCTGIVAGPDVVEVDSEGRQR